MNPGQELVISNRETGVKLFGGYIKEVTRKLVRPDYYLETCQAQDYQKLIADVASGVTADYSAGNKTEKTILTELFAAHCPSITVGDHVITGELMTITFSNSSLRRAIDNLAAVHGRKWYVDYDKEFHYFNVGDEAASFELSDDPDNVTTFPYGSLEYTIDEDSNESGNFICWKEGLFAGMTVNVTNSKFSWTAKEVLIYQVTSKIIGGDLHLAPVLEFEVHWGYEPKRVTNDVVGAAQVITGDRLADNTISSAKISDLSVDKLSAGNLLVTFTITTGEMIVRGQKLLLHDSNGNLLGYVYANEFGINFNAASGKGVSLARNSEIVNSNAAVLSAGRTNPTGTTLFANITGDYIELDANWLVLPMIPVANQPSNAIGRLYYDTTNNVIKYYNGSAWKTIATV